MPLIKYRESGEAYARPFLKWAGGKYQIIDRVFAQLPPGKRLMEPFSGAAVVSINADYNRLAVSDDSPDLINLFISLKEGRDEFIAYVKDYFTPANNSEESYYRLRERFNHTSDIREKSALFIYLNRHGYNGLSRYNSKGGFNVPFGRYKRPYFPVEEMRYFHNRMRQADFGCMDFTQAMGRARKGDVVYADPPYVPLSSTAKFTGYSKGGFGREDQLELARQAELLAGRGIPVLISNHDTEFTREVYREAQLTKFPVQRHISCKGEQRNEVQELLAFYPPRD